MDKYNFSDAIIADLEDEPTIVHTLKDVGPLYDKLIERGFIFSTEVPEGASYIMPDGKFLGIRNNKAVLELTDTQVPAHPQLDTYILETGLVPEDSLINRVLCETDNAVRVNDGSNILREVIIGLPQYEPTEAQYNSIEEFLYTLLTRHKSDTITVGDERTEYAFQKYNLRETLPEDIVKKIRAYYKGGILREDLVKVINK